jgi:hypothetical protein
MCVCLTYRVVDHFEGGGVRRVKSGCGVNALGRARSGCSVVMGAPRPPRIGALVLAATMALGSATAVARAEDRQEGIRLAQQGDLPYLNVAPTIVVAPGSEVRLPIKVSSLDVLPQKSFLSLRGLPPTIGLTEGQRLGPGSWTVALSLLPKMKAVIPEGLAAQAEVVISLIGMDGKLIGQSKAILIVGPASSAPPEARSADKVEEASAATSPTPGGAPEDRRPAVSRSTVITAEERARAEGLVAQGEVYLAQGKVAGARLLFRQAAESNFALAAMRLAATYDPAELSALKVLGVNPDIAEARRWYERARELGAPDAEQRLASLPRN